MNSNDPNYIPELPPPPHECPISSIIGRRLVDMNDEELNQSVSNTRVLSETPATLRTLLKGKVKQPRQKKMPAKIDLSLLGI